MTSPDPAHDAPTRRSLVIGLVLGAVFLFAAAVVVWQLSHDPDAAGDGERPAPGAGAVVGEATADDGAAPADRRVAIDGLRGDRYCEILAVTAEGGSNIAEVWNTIELNDCPDAAWDALDVGASLADAADRYVVREVTRRTVFTWEGDRTVGILTDPDGSEFVLQAWSLQQADDLGDDALPTLGGRLQLPAGWSFGVRELDAPLVIDTTERPARVLQDDLGNAYTQLPG